MSTPPPTDRVRLRRQHTRGAYDKASIHSILDVMPMCSVGYVFDGRPLVTPTFQWRDGNDVFWHGSSASRMLRAVDTADVCLTVAVLDGLVVARSGFHHSVNYRSAMLLGNARRVDDPEEMEARLKAFVDGLFPRRWDALRPATAQELRATTVMTMPIDEAAAKVRTGPPVDDEEDYALSIWGGVIPIRMQVLDPVPDPRNIPGVEPPEHTLNDRLG